MIFLGFNAFFACQNLASAEDIPHWEGYAFGGFLFAAIIKFLIWRVPSRAQALLDWLLIAGLVARALRLKNPFMMAVLDGVKVIDEAHTELYLRTGSGELLNGDHDLHELFQIAVDHELGYVDEFGNPLT